MRAGPARRRGSRRAAGTVEARAPELAWSGRRDPPRKLADGRMAPSEGSSGGSQMRALVPVRHVFLRTVLVLVLACGASAAAQEAHKDERLGFQLRPPRGWKE